MKRFSFFFLLATLVLSGSFLLSGFSPAFPSTFSLSLLAKLPNEVVESSGLEVAEQPGTYWTHNDGGNAPILYQVSEKGKLLAQVTVPGTRNNDWEDLTRDTKGYLYIGDTGNNKNKRQDLVIYKVAPRSGFKAQAIRYKYSDQPAGKVEKKDRNFDCEAIFWHNNKLYLISKDRGEGKTAKLYELPDTPGTHTAKLVTKTTLPGMVTSADLSPNGRHLAVLTFGKVYLYPVIKGSNQFFAKRPKILELQEAGQVEAVTFKNNSTILISNEGGSLFQYTL